MALLIETSKSYGRGLLGGVTRYLRAHKPWSVDIDERGLEDPAPAWLPRWAGDGILLRTAEPAVVRAVRRRGVPVVCLGERRDGGLPLLESCDSAIVDLAIGHLVERGFKRFGYAGLRGRPWSDERRDLFVERLARRGYPCTVCDLAAPGGAAARPLQERALAGWLAALPTPAAVLACYDVMGLRVLDACRALGIAVPEKVAVVGVDNDPHLCALADPPLTSVAHDLDRIGYEAAELLDRLMAGHAPPRDPVRRIPPAGVVARQSTDTLAIDEAPVAQAVRFIRQRACEGIAVGDVLRHVGLNRLTLTRRFLRILGRTPKAEIQRIRMDRCRQLLVETDFKLDKIAALAGFWHPEYMNVAFKRETGQTPGDFRRTHRAPA